MTREFLALVEQRKGADLSQIENEILAATRRNFYEKAIGIYNIVDRKLYKKEYDKIETWAEEVLGWSRQRVYQYLDAHAVVTNLIILGAEVLPGCESHCRTIREVDLPHNDYVEFWWRVQDRVQSGERLTSKLIHKELEKQIITIKKDDPELFSQIISTSVANSFPKLDHVGFVYDPVGFCDFRWDLSPMKIIPNPASNHFSGRSVRCLVDSEDDMEIVAQTALKSPDWVYIMFMEGDSYMSDMALPGNVIRAIRAQNEEDSNIISLFNSTPTMIYLQPERPITIPENVNWVVFGNNIPVKLFVHCYNQVENFPAVYIPKDVIEEMYFAPLEIQE